MALYIHVFRFRPHDYKHGSSLYPCCELTFVKGEESGVTGLDHHFQSMSMESFSPRSTELQIEFQKLK